MKTTDHFKNTIKSYLDNRALEDTLFAEKYANEKKNIDDCCTYILNEVQKTGCNGFTDEEVYGMAVHYYDEESIDVGNEISCRVSVNHIVELTEEEKLEARQKAIDTYQEEYRRKLAEQRKKKQKKEFLPEETREVEQLSLF